MSHFEITPSKNYTILVEGDGPTYQLENVTITLEGEATSLNNVSINLITLDLLKYNAIHPVFRMLQDAFDTNTPLKFTVAGKDTLTFKARIEKPPGFSFAAKATAPFSNTITLRLFYALTGEMKWK